MASELVVKQSAHPALSFGPFTVTPIGLVIEKEPTWEEWQKLYDNLARIEDFSNWAIGDAEAFTRPRYGEASSQLTAQWPEDTYEVVRKSRWTSERVGFGRRRPNLSWAHHREVAPLEPGEQDYWLEQAELNHLPHKELRAAIRKARLANVNPLGGPYSAKLYLGEMETILPTLGQFDCIVTDPPYGVSANYDSIDDIEWDAYQDYLHTARGWLSVIREALKPEYNLFWFCSPSYAADFEVMFRELNLPIKSRIIWAKRSLPKGRIATDKFVSTWEMALHAGNRELNFPAEWSDAWFDVQYHNQPLTSMKDEDRKVHETQKPHDLIARLVGFGSYPGDRVCDPFAGSGSVGAACPDDRECILIERDEEYARRIEVRLNIQHQAR